MKPISRLKTGIKDFDKLIEGGIPVGYNILLSGSPGTGKTIFAMEFLKNGSLKYDEPGMFITFEETSSNLIMQSNQLGDDIEKLHKQNKLIIKSMPEQENLNENILIKMISDGITNYNVKRLVIDSLDTYANNIISFEDNDKILSSELLVKRAVYRLIKKLQRFSGITKILISETEENADNLSKDGVSEFLCDGVVKIEYLTMGGNYSRQLKVRKMRATDNNPDSFPFEISKRGILVHVKDG